MARRCFFKSRISSAIVAVASMGERYSSLNSIKALPGPLIMEAVRAVLISTYEMGRQPFGLASPAAWLRREGHTVTCVDLSRAPLPRAAVEEAELIAFFLPMHTATRLFLR